MRRRNKEDHMETISNKVIGEALKKARVDSGLTQHDISNLTGLARSTITKYELGDIEISLPNFIMMCNAMGISPTKVLRGILQ